MHDGKNWSLIEKSEINGAYLGLPECLEDYECFAIKPKNLEEITAINAYIESITYGNGDKLTHECIGKVVALDFGCDYSYCFHCILEDNLKQIAKYTNEVIERFKK